MSRSGYVDNCDGWDLIRWRGAVNSAIKGKRGQALLQEMAKALDAMPNKRLIAGAITTTGGEVCALGAVARFKGLEVEGVDPEDSEKVCGIFNIAGALAKEIAFENDYLHEYGEYEPSEQRWQRMRKWVDENLLVKP